MKVYFSRGNNWTYLSVTALKKRLMDSLVFLDRVVIVLLHSTKKFKRAKQEVVSHGIHALGIRRCSAGERDANRNNYIEGLRVVASARQVDGHKASVV